MIICVLVKIPCELDLKHFLWIVMSGANYESHRVFVHNKFALCGNIFGTMSRVFSPHQTSQHTAFVSSAGNGSVGADKEEISEQSTSHKKLD